MPDDHVIELQGIAKRFAGHTAVQDLSLRVNRGAVYGLLGPNGAGKTTTIRMVMNITLPDAGVVRLFGNARGGRDQSHRIGYLPEERGLYRKMKVLELLTFLGETKGVARGHARREADRWLQQLELGAWADKRVDDLSKGMQQKVQFIATVLHGPELLILDEPFAGFDPVNTQLLKDIVVDLARGGTTVLLSTHIMEQAERMCDAVCIIAKGRMVVDGPLADVKRRHGGRHVIVALEEGNAGVDRLLRDRTVVATADDYGNYAEIELAEGADPQVLLAAFVREGARVSRFEVAEPTLHKIFIDMVGADAAGAREGARHA